MMDVKRLRQLRRADPYKPFYLVLTDGTRLPVERAVFMAISPLGTEISYSPVEGGFSGQPDERVAEVMNLQTA